MKRKLLCGVLSTVLFGQASVALAENCGTDHPDACMHSSQLVNFTGYKTIEAKVTFTNSSGDVIRIYSGTSCINGYGLYFGEGSIRPGVMQIDLSIETADGSFEPISEYDVVFTGKPRKAIHADPKSVVIDMSSYADYPACEPIPFVLDTQAK